MTRFKQIHALLALTVVLVGSVLSVPLTAQALQNTEPVPNALTGQGAEQSRWLFLGDSITYAGHYVDYIETWLLLNDAQPLEIIDLGVSSETVANTSEPDHPYKRPWLLNRLDLVLERVKPDVVFACYGMNDGIYHPLSEDRFSAFQQGITTLIEQTRANGASLILLTPPPYAGRIWPRPTPGDGESYSYKKPYPDYNRVLAAYSEWLLTLNEYEDIQVIDIRPALEASLEESYPKEPVHPGVYGHQIIAEAILQELGKTQDPVLHEGDSGRSRSDPQWADMLDLVSQQREIYDRALLNDIGHGNPNIKRQSILAMADAEELVKPVNAGIAQLKRAGSKRTGSESGARLANLAPDSDPSHRHRDPSHRPNFSWDTVPLYAHFGDREGMNDEEVEFIASHYDFIVLEKAHGIEKYGYTEQGTIEDVARIKALNPQAKMLYYWNLLLDYPLYEASLTREDDQSWFIHGADGELDLKGTGPGALKKYDLSNEDWRHWWVSVAKDMLKRGSMDGVFIDALPQVALKPEAKKKDWGVEKYLAIEQGIGETLAELKREIGPDTTIIYNGIRSVPGGWEHGGTKYLEFTDGAIIEHFNVILSQEPEQIAEDIERMTRAGKDGKIVILKAFPGFLWIDKEDMKMPLSQKRTLARQRITFPLAAFLIAAQEHSYFNYTWGYRADHGAFEWYPEFDHKLGPPKGDAVRDGYEYRREFEHASVYINIESKQAEIDWR